MSRTAVPARLDDRSYWRRLMATVHPDRDGGDHELFLFLQGLREHVERCQGREAHSANAQRQGEGHEDRILYDPSLGYADEHIMLTMRATSIGARSEEPFASTMMLLLGCPSEEHGRTALRQCRGASYKQLAYIAHLAGMDKAQRARWYDLARTVPLSEQHAHHLISKLKQASPGEAAA